MQIKTPHISIVIVTHQSASVIGHCLTALLEHFASDLMNICIVDSASPDVRYLQTLQKQYPQIKFIFEANNVGFCLGNNIGYRAMQQNNSEFVLFLNPDAFITSELLPKLVVRMQQPAWAHVAACTPLLMGYSLAENAPSGLVDSAGIKMSPYGRFFDRGQGSQHIAQLSQNTEVDAICGAFMLCRRAMLEDVSPNGEVFDEHFYMYKEDVDLSLRLRRAGGRLMLCADLVAYHCRGWHGSRARMPRWTILQSIRNDWRVWWKFCGYLFPNSMLSFFYLIIKSFVVSVEIWIIRGFFGKGR